MGQPSQLKRSLSLTQMVLYGLGTTIGAGIYALIGELAGVSGYMAPAAFLLASMMAGLTALSFAELSSRYPYAAGASLYVKQGFRSDRLAILVGLLVTLVGVVSSAALINAFINYLGQFISIDRYATIFIICLIIGTLAAWGIAESVFIASVITVIEIGGLLLVIGVSHPALSELPQRWHELLPDSNFSSWFSISAGALLAFYAFIGFEDMVDVAEEIKDVRRNLPRAILLTLAITTIIYMLIMVTAVLSMTPAQLAQEPAPLITLFNFHTGSQTPLIGIIGMLAIINGALIQTIMASRVLYGLSARGHLHHRISQVNHVTRTPLIATAIAISGVFSFAISGSLATLAEITSLIMLTVFALANLALWKIKRRDPKPAGVIIFPRWLPITGFFVSTGFVVAEFWKFLITLV